MAKPLGSKKATRKQVRYLIGLLSQATECDEVCFEDLTHEQITELITPLVALIQKAKREGSYYPPAFYDSLENELLEDLYGTDRGGPWEALHF